MKYPAEFEITELANSQPTAGPEPNAAVDQRQSTQDNLRDGLQEVIGELIRQRRNLEEQLNEERDEHVRESRSLYEAACDRQFIGTVDPLDEPGKRARQQPERRTS